MDVKLPLRGGSSSTKVHRNPPFLRLPVELLQQITEKLHYLDIERITLTCRHLHRVAEHQLVQHRRLKEEFTRIRCETDGDIGDHPMGLLQKVTKDMAIAAYPTRMTIGRCTHDRDSFRFGRNGQRVQLDDYLCMSADKTSVQVERVENLLKRIFKPNSRVFAEWDLFAERISAAHAGHVLAFLLIILPHLEVITFEFGEDNVSPWLEIVAEISVMSHANPSGGHPLHHLHTINIVHPEYGYYGRRDSCRSLFSFVGLPSLRTVYAKRMAARSVPRQSNALPCRITRIEFEECNLSRRALTTLLNNTSSLQEFIYINCVAWQIHSERSTTSVWQPRSIVECLSQYASHSLRSLTMLQGRGDSYWYRENPVISVFIGSLRGFRALTSICIDVPMIMDSPNQVPEDLDEVETPTDSEEDYDDSISPTWYLDVSKDFKLAHSLINVLPASCQTLSLEMQADEHIMRQMLDRLPERKAVRLPNLERITYQCEERCVTGMEEACKIVGVELVQVLKFGGIKHQRRHSIESEYLQSECDSWQYWDGVPLWEDDAYYCCEERDPVDRYLHYDNKDRNVECQDLLRMYEEANGIEYLVDLAFGAGLL